MFSLSTNPKRCQQIRRRSGANLVQIQCKSGANPAQIRHRPGPPPLKQKLRRRLREGQQLRSPFPRKKKRKRGAGQQLRSPFRSPEKNIKLLRGRPTISVAISQKKRVKEGKANNFARHFAISVARKNVKLLRGRPTTSVAISQKKSVKEGKANNFRRHFGRQKKRKTSEGKANNSLPAYSTGKDATKSRPLVLRLRLKLRLLWRTSSIGK